MSEAPSEAPERLVGGHLVIYRAPDGAGVIAFRPDGGADDEVIRRDVPGVMLPTVVSLFEGGQLVVPPMLDMGRLARQARTALRGGDGDDG